MVGLVTTDQALPFHDSTSVTSSLLGFSYSPTAVQELADTHDTLLRSEYVTVARGNAPGPA
jgi:hypothetical protein